MYLNGEPRKYEKKYIYMYGTAYYNDGLVASDAIIIVEKINGNTSCIIGYTVSDSLGKFLIRLEDRNSYYKISAFYGKLNGEFYSRL